MTGPGPAWDLEAGGADLLAGQAAGPDFSGALPSHQVIPVK